MQTREDLKNQVLTAYVDENDEFKEVVLFTTANGHGILTIRKGSTKQVEAEYYINDTKLTWTWGEVADRDFLQAVMDKAGV